MWVSAAASCSALFHHARRRWVSSGSKDGPPLTPRPGEPNVAVNTATKTTQLSGPIPAGSKAVAATASSLISSARPVTGAGRNMRLSLRLRGPGDEEGSLTVRGSLEQGATPGSVVRRPGKKALPPSTSPSWTTSLPHRPHPTPALVSAPRRRLSAFCRDACPPRSHHQQL